MPIDPCQCPSTIEGLLKAIYCTLYDIAENGAVVNLDNISGISPFWKATLGGTPAADQVFGTNGAGVFTTFDITDVGINIIAMAAPADDSFLWVDQLGDSFFTVTGGDATQNPVTEITTIKGVVTAMS